VVSDIIIAIFAFNFRKVEENKEIITCQEDAVGSHVRC
jgi:hypothetical protein